MLPSKKRISKDSFKSILVGGTVIHSPNFTLRTVSSSVEGYAVLVSKKVAPQAVLRNKIRRRVYSIIHKASPFIKKTAKNIISAKAGVKNLSFSATQEEVFQLLKKALQ